MQNPIFKPGGVTGTLTFLLLSLFVSQLAAEDFDQLSRTELKDNWGQLFFCQSIYKMPEVKPRLYDFDIEQCNTASQLIAELVAKYPLQEQQAMKLQAEKHAVLLSYNTSEPYHSVPACRQYCKKLEKIRQERVAAGSK